jgi:hypothetical protein
MYRDYDVQALALQSPPALAVVTSYRPAVLVRNNGVHEAYASGYVRIYSAGLLIFTTEVYSAAIQPGQTGPALGTEYWTPPAEGQYVVNGYVTCPLDQDEPNNNLAPVTITVSGLPPPPPTPVPLHAAQHEEGGKDELSIDGLVGLARNPQIPTSHGTTHQAGGSDRLNVGALLGELADDQPPKTHGNTKHNPQMVTASALSQHEGATSAHTAATNLEQKANKGVANGYAELDGFGAVPILELAIGTDTGFGKRFLAEDRKWTSPIPAGLVVLWETPNPAPTGWTEVVLSSPPPIGYIWIKYVPSA